MNTIKPEGISAFRTNKKIRTEVKVKVDFDLNVSTESIDMISKEIKDMLVAMGVRV